MIIGNKPVLSKYWISKGNIFIQDLCNQDGCFLSYNELCHKYNISNSFMMYIRILSNIKNLVKNNKQYKEMSLTQILQKHFENTCLKTIGEDSTINIKKAKCKVYYNI